MSVILLVDGLPGNYDGTAGRGQVIAIIHLNAQNRVIDYAKNVPHVAPWPMLHVTLSSGTAHWDMTASIPVVHDRFRFVTSPPPS